MDQYIIRMAMDLRSQADVVKFLPMVAFGSTTADPVANFCPIVLQRLAFLGVKLIINFDASSCTCERYLG